MSLWLCEVGRSRETGCVGSGPADRTVRRGAWEGFGLRPVARWVRVDRAGSGGVASESEEGISSMGDGDKGLGDGWVRRRAAWVIAARREPFWSMVFGSCFGVGDGGGGGLGSMGGMVVAVI